MPLTPAQIALLDQAKLAMKARQYTQAIELYEQGAAEDPEAVEFQEALGIASSLTGQTERAIEHFLQVTQLAPRKTSAFVNLGALYNQLGEYQKAVDYSRKAVQIDRKSADGYYNLGLAHRRLKQNALAVPAYREAVRINPKLIVAHQNLGNVFLDMGNVQQAITHFKLALEIDPTFEKARAGLQKAEALKHDHKTAQNPFGRLVDTDAAEKSSMIVCNLHNLSTADREDDRSNIRGLNRTILRHLRELRACLKDKLEPMLVELNLAVMNNDDLNVELTQFKPVCVRFSESTEHLNTLTRELAAHQARMLHKQA